LSAFDKVIRGDNAMVQHIRSAQVIAQSGTRWILLSVKTLSR